ncbi:hypothetical protein KZZ52_26640 [Dactylosporangium sp. AC04546]|uniref:hypothetical protein n=1 Tax=Dactylosporangium sp. AC04546 TaxID=2862460 RepID=UPI001EDF8896|nr:hypothetical protein [Dactylosporangium sp. AC04546]WVK88848.1 hypothetical protein KZZ52_26640 [Dactylosporangium sp. AC04546]
MTEVPYDGDGNLLHYVDPWATPTMRPNEPFKAALQVEMMESGRSAKYLIWRDGDGRRFPMFIIDLVDMLQRAEVLQGAVEATWIVRKRGQNYGIALAPDGQA